MKKIGKLINLYNEEDRKINQSISTMKKIGNQSISTMKKIGNQSISTMKKIRKPRKVRR
jgi:hypothetical protein